VSTEIILYFAVYLAFFNKLILTVVNIITSLRGCRNDLQVTEVFMND